MHADEYFHKLRPEVGSNTQHGFVVMYKNQSIKASAAAGKWSGVMAERDQVTTGDDTTVLLNPRWGWGWVSCTPIMGPQFLSPAGMFHQILVLSCFHILSLSQKESTDPSGAEQLLCITMPIKAWR